MNQMDAGQADDRRDAEPQQPVTELAQAAQPPLSQAELSVMHPASDDADWRCFFGALHS